MTSPEIQGPKMTKKGDMKVEWWNGIMSVARRTDDVPE